MNTEINISKLAESIGYSEVTGNECVMIHKKSGDFALVSNDKASAREAQGWVECVSASTLDSLGIAGDTSDDGLTEAKVIAEWMAKQD